MNENKKIYNGDMKVIKNNVKRHAIYDAGKHIFHWVENNHGICMLITETTLGHKKDTYQVSFKIKPNRKTGSGVMFLGDSWSYLSERDIYDGVVNAKNYVLPVGVYSSEDRETLDFLSFDRFLNQDSYTKEKYKIIK